MEYTNAAVVIVSFDGYNDLWDTFFECYFKFWKNNHLKTYLITNNLKPFYDNVEVIQTGDEVSWSRRVKTALEKIKEDNLLVVFSESV